MDDKEIKGYISGTDLDNDVNETKVDIKANDYINEKDSKVKIARLLLKTVESETK